MNDSQKLIIAKKILLGFDGLGQAEIVEGQAIFVKNNKINEIGPTSVLRQKYKEIPDFFKIEINGGKDIAFDQENDLSLSNIQSKELEYRETIEVNLNPITTTRSSRSPTGALVR